MYIHFTLNDILLWWITCHFLPASIVLSFFNVPLILNSESITSGSLVNIMRLITFIKTVVQFTCSTFGDICIWKKANRHTYTIHFAPYEEGLRLRNEEKSCKSFCFQHFHYILLCCAIASPIVTFAMICFPMRNGFCKENFYFMMEGE